MDRAQLADFLRTRREALQPADVGLSPGLRRRTPGLRREQVAALADMSVDYYTRLEQARGPHPSAPMVAALARALRCSNDEREHLYHLTDHLPPSANRAVGHVSAGLCHLLDRLADLPAFVVTDIGEVAAQNPLAAALFGDVTRASGRGRNSIWRFFLDPEAQERSLPEDRETQARAHVAELRATHGRRGKDADVASLVRDLQAASAEFAALWAEHEVGHRRLTAKRIVHPEVGVVDLVCEHLDSAATHQTLVVLYPRPGSPAREQLDLLRVIGTQDLTPPVRT